MAFFFLSYFFLIPLIELNIYYLHVKVDLPMILCLTQEYGPSFYMITFGSWNVKGFDVNKFKVVSFSMYDIFCVSESLVANGAHVSLPGYKHIMHPATKLKKLGRPSGWILVYYKAHLHKGITVVSKSAQCVWLKLHKTFFNISKDIFLCALYIKPSSSAAEAEMAYNILSNSVINHSEPGDIILMGDFNSRTVHTQDYALCDRNHSGKHSIPLPDDYIFDTTETKS